MALDGILLHKIIQEISPLLPLRIQRIYQISTTEVLFHVHGRNGKQQLMISCHSQYNRMLMTKRAYPTPAEPGNFGMVLRKYLEGATLAELSQKDLDRWCVFTVRRHNEIGDPEEMKLYVELMGKYANIILVNAAGLVVDALKRIPPFENTRRTIHPGAKFHETPPQNKRDPFVDWRIEADKTLTQQFAGFSPFLAEEAEYRMAHGQSMQEIMQEIAGSKRLYIANRNNEAVFHCLPLTATGPCVDYPLFEGFDILYYHKEEKDRIKQISGDVFQAVKRHLKHQKTKLPRLLKEYDEVVYIPMSSGLSSSCQTAGILAGDYDGRVQVVDNHRISVTMFQSVLDACTLRDQGHTAAEIKTILETEAANSSIYIMVDTLKYLVHGGRITPAAAAMGSLLHIKPVLQIQGGALDTYQKCRGEHKARKVMMEAMHNDLDTRFKEEAERGEMEVFYSCCGISKEEEAAWQAAIQEAFPEYTVTGRPLSMSIAVHIGPGALAIACARKI